MVSVTFGDYDRLDLKAIGDFALVPDKFFVRLVGVAKQQEGYGASLDFTCEMIRRGTPQLAGIGDGLGFGGYRPDSTGPTGDFDYRARSAAADRRAGRRAPPTTLFRLPAARSITQDGTCELGTLGGTSSEAGRVMLRFLPSDKLDINLSFDLSNSDDDPNVDTQTLADQQRHGQRVRHQRRVSPATASTTTTHGCSDRRPVHELRDVRRSS